MWILTATRTARLARCIATDNCASSATFPTIRGRNRHLVAETMNLRRFRAVELRGCDCIEVNFTERSTSTRDAQAMAGDNRCSRRVGRCYRSANQHAAEVSLEGPALASILIRERKFIAYSFLVREQNHPRTILYAFAGRQLFALGIEQAFSNGTQSMQAGCRRPNFHVDFAQTHDSDGPTPTNGARCAGRLSRGILRLPGSDLYAWQSNYRCGCHQGFGSRRKQGATGPIPLAVLFLHRRPICELTRSKIQGGLLSRKVGRARVVCSPDGPKGRSRCAVLFPTMPWFLIGW